MSFDPRPRARASWPRLWFGVVALVASACGQGGGYAGGIRSYAYYVYVTNQGAGTISPFSILGTGNLFPLTEVSSGGNSPVGIAVHPSMTFVYVLNQQATSSTGSSVAIFSVSSADGSLSQVSIAALPSGCVSLALDPAARFIYAACESEIATLGVSGDGSALSGLQTAVVTGTVSAVAADPTGRFLYATNSTASTVSSYSISGTGALTLVNSVATDTSPVAVAVDPKNRFVVTANLATNDLSVASVAAASGTLTTVGNFNVGTNAEPKGVIVDPTGEFVYTTANNLDTVNSFAVQTNFSLTTLSSYATDLLPTALAYSPDAAYSVVVNSGSANDIFLYGVSAGGTWTYSDEGAADAQPSAVAIARFLAPALF